MYNCEFLMDSHAEGNLFMADFSFSPVSYLKTVQQLAVDECV